MRLNVFIGDVCAHVVIFRVLLYHIPSWILLWTRKSSNRTPMSDATLRRMSFNLRHPKWIRISITVSTRGACMFNVTSDGSCFNAQIVHTYQTCFSSRIAQAKLTQWVEQKLRLILNFAFRLLKKLYSCKNIYSTISTSEQIGGFRNVLNN